MGFFDNKAGEELWKNAVAAFARKIGVNPESTTVDLNLNNNAGATLATGILPSATSSSAGVMTAADKAKLDGVASRATAVTVDDAMSSTSTNPVQNKVLAAAFSAANLKADLGNTPVNRATGDASGNNLQSTYATKAEVQTAMAGVASYKGTVDSNDTISGSSYKTSWYWFVGTAGTYVGATCEAGDMIIANADRGSAYSASDFDVVQTNIAAMTIEEVDAICTL